MLAAELELRLFDFFCGGYTCILSNFNGVLPGNETVNFFSFNFWHFSVRYNVLFTKIICSID